MPHPRTRPLDRPTRWPLPDDSSIDALPPDERQAIGRLWAGRIQGELRAIPAFAYLAEALSDLGAGADLIALAARASDDERRHASLCATVASRYLGREVEVAPDPPLDLPALEGAPPVLRKVLHVIGLSCLNETTSSAFIEAALKGATAPLATAALRELLSDEVDHARIGWALLASPLLDESFRALISRWLPALVAANLRVWHRPLPAAPWPASFAEHGCPSTEVSNEAVRVATRELILPGFAHVGIDASGVTALASD